MSDKMDRAIARAIDDAERAGCCWAPHSRTMRGAVRYRGRTFVEPIRGLFARRATWQGLEPPQRMLWLMRPLARLHPAWRFCGASAAVAYGLPVSWGWLSRVFVASPSGTTGKATSGVARRCIADDACEWRDGLPLTTFWRTVFDCLAEFEFADAVAVADAALRLGGTSAYRLAEYLRTEYRGHRGLRRALRAAEFADARSESGGESVARAVMHELGFAAPELQVWIRDPVDPQKWFRVDFLWVTSDGRLIIGEMDGRQKSVRPELMDGRGTVRVLQDERLRESHLTALHPAIVRFSYDDVVDRARFEALLDSFGVPRATEEFAGAPIRVTTRAELVAEGDAYSVRTQQAAA